MADRKEDIAQQRLSKLSRIKSRGINPYPQRYQRTHTVQQALSLLQPEGGAAEPPEVRLAGRIIAERKMGKATFIDLRDGSGKIQVYLREDEVGGEKYQHLDDFDIGDFIGVSGRVFKTHTGEITVRAADFVMLCKSLQPLPEKWHGLVDVEKRYRQRYLDLISSEQVRHIFASRLRAIAAIRRFLDGRGFVEVETPVLQPIAAGAMARPFVTHHQALDRDLYLRIALELHLKRLIVSGFDKIYEIGRVFRNEGISTKHNPEFTMLESYEAYADYNNVMTMVEEMVAYVAQEVLGSTKITFAGNVISLSPPWRRVSLREEIQQKSGIDFLDEQNRDLHSLRRRMEGLGVEAEENMSWGRLLDKLISTFVEPTLIQPTFVLDYPVELSPLAKTKPDDPRLVERFEGFIGGLEVANAFTELNDPIEQRGRFQKQEEWRLAYGDEQTDRWDEDFLVAMEHGMPPTGGLGMGIDRLVMLLTDQHSVREVILFPQLKEK